MRKRSGVRPYHTPSTIPECVRPEVVEGWNRLWNRLRRWSRQDRSLEFKSGTPLRVGENQFSIRWVDSAQYIDDDVGTRMRVWVLELGQNLRVVDGSCAFGEGKPYAHLDDLQSALDELIMENVMEA